MGRGTEHRRHRRDDDMTNSTRYADAADLRTWIIDTAAAEGVDLDQIQAGQAIYLPQQLSDGSINYFYANGASISTSGSTTSRGAAI